MGTINDNNDGHVIFAGPGGDTINGRGGDDQLTGGASADALNGGTGNDSIDGVGGADKLDGGAGDDLIRFTRITDLVGDSIQGGAGYDSIQGNPGFSEDEPKLADFSFTTIGGVEVLTGGFNVGLTASQILGFTKLSSQIVTIMSLGDVNLSGREDLEVVTFRLNAAGNTLDLTGDARVIIPGEPETLAGYGVLGGDASDTVYGGKAGDDIDGAGGNDHLEGGEGVDKIQGGAGNDTIYGGDGDDNFGGLVGGVGNDTIFGGAGNDFLNGNEGKDDLSGETGEDSILGGTGADTLDGGAGNDTVAGQEGNDVLRGGGGSDSIEGGIGKDSLDGGQGADTLIGGEDSDSYYVDDSSDYIVEFVGQGTDTVFARADYVLATGRSIEFLRAASDSGLRLTGNAFNDQILGAAGNDVLTGGIGKDSLTGGAGKDIFDFNAVAETGKTPQTRDVIVDFNAGTAATFVDRIDLRDIDAETGGGNQAFTFIGSDAFHSIEGELRVSHTGAGTLVSADVNGDGAADFEITLSGSINLDRFTAADFLL